jgi:hypothetical protein
VTPCTSTFLSLSHNSPCLVRCMVPTSQAPSCISPLSSSSTVPELMRVSLRPGWKCKVHQVRNALLPTATIWILHTGHLSLCILIHESVGSLALRLVLRLCSLRIARSGVAGRRVGADAAVGVCEEGLGGGDGGSSRRGAGDLLRVRGSLGESGRLRRHCRRC